jgi:hypothetical protein
MAYSSSTGDVYERGAKHTETSAASSPSAGPIVRPQVTRLSVCRGPRRGSSLSHGAHGPHSPRANLGLPVRASNSHSGTRLDPAGAGPSVWRLSCFRRQTAKLGSQKIPSNVCFSVSVRGVATSPSRRTCCSVVAGRGLKCQSRANSPFGKLRRARRWRSLTTVPC